MGIGSSIFLIAVGAILRYAVTGEVQGIRIHTVGLILMIVGVLGLILTFVYLNLWDRDRRRGGYVEREREYTDPRS